MSPPGAPRAVVLGGSGYVGAGVCTRLHAAGYHVLAVGRRPPDPGNPWAATVLDFVEAAPAELAGLLAGAAPELVVNAAGAVWDCTEEQMGRLNRDLVARLLTALAGRPEPARLVQLGSVHEYGAQPAATRLVESAPAEPITPYGRTKLQGTELVLDAAAAGRVPGVVLRVTNVLGVGAPAVSLAGRVAAQLARAARAGTRAELSLSPLHAERDFVDVRDVAEAVLRAARAPVVGQLINVGSGQPVPGPHGRRPADPAQRGARDRTRDRPPGEQSQPAPGLAGGGCPAGQGVAGLAAAVHARRFAAGTLGVGAAVTAADPVDPVRSASRSYLGPRSTGTQAEPRKLGRNRNLPRKRCVGDG